MIYETVESEVESYLSTVSCVEIRWLLREHIYSRKVRMRKSERGSDRVSLTQRQGSLTQPASEQGISHPP